MFNMAKKTITLNNKIEKIQKFEVWFQTPFGLYDDFDEAVKKLIASDMDPELSLRPVSVAITQSIYEVIG